MAQLTPTNRSFQFNDGDWNRLRNILNIIGTSTFPQLETDISGSFVPYTGADQNVDLGSFNLTTTGLGTFGEINLNKVGANIITATDANGDLRLGAGGGTNDLKIDKDGNVDVF
ncbi:hypothetical protein LCGC14_2379190, partial [marine sediment metagenome]